MRRDQSRRRRGGEGRALRQRRATLRLWLMGYSLDEIAAVFGISEKAVRKRLRRMGAVVV